VACAWVLSSNAIRRKSRGKKLPVPSWPAELCAGSGAVRLLQYAADNGLVWNKRDVILAAAFFGRTRCIEWLVGRGCRWHPLVTARAAWAGRISCLQWLHEAGCPWDAETTKSASESNQLECLVYAHTHGCEWDEGTTSYAMNNGNDACLEYALSGGCSVDVSETVHLALYRQLTPAAVKVLTDFAVIASSSEPPADAEIVHASITSWLLRTCPIRI
jgi:hypothetical protein